MHHHASVGRLLKRRRAQRSWRIGSDAHCADSPAWWQVIELSCAEGVPCAHTSMVGFHTTTAALADLRAARKSRRRVSPAKIAVGGIAILGERSAGDLA